MVYRLKCFFFSSLLFFTFSFYPSSTSFQSLVKENQTIDPFLLEKFLKERPARLKNRAKYLTYKLLKKSILKDLAREFKMDSQKKLTYKEFDDILFKQVKITGKKISVYCFYIFLLIMLAFLTVQMNLLLASNPAMQAFFNIILGSFVASFSTVLFYPSTARLQQYLWAAVDVENHDEVQEGEDEKGGGNEVRESLNEIYQKLNSKYAGTEQMAKNTLMIDASVLLIQLGNIESFVYQYEGDFLSLEVFLREQLAVILTLFIRYNRELTMGDDLIKSTICMSLKRIKFDLQEKYHLQEDHLFFSSFKENLKKEMLSLDSNLRPIELEMAMKTWPL